MGVYKVLRSFQCDGAIAYAGQFIEADDVWASERLNSEVDPDLSPDMIVFVKKVSPKQVPADQKVLRITVGPGSVEKTAVARTKPVRSTTPEVETKPVRAQQ